MVKHVLKFRIIPEFAYRQSFGGRKNRSIIVHGKDSKQEPPEQEAKMMSIRYLTLFCHNSEVSYPSNLRVSVI